MDENHSDELVSHERQIGEPNKGGAEAPGDTAGKWFVLTFVALFLIQAVFFDKGFWGALFISLFWAVVAFIVVTSNASTKKEELERQASAAEEEEKRRTWRDADVQEEPYTYEIGRHANETLALRYGLANCTGGKEGKRIKIRKKRSMEADKYLVELPDFGNREAVAIIEPGTEYVKTFYPMSDDWFERNGKLEDLLKNNAGMPIVEIAKFHIHAALTGRLGD